MIVTPKRPAPTEDAKIQVEDGNEFLRRFRDADVRIVSADRKVAVRLNGGSHLDVGFAPGEFKSLDEAALSTVLPDLLRRVHDAREEKRREIVGELTGRNIAPYRQWQLDARQREFRERRDEVHARGKSADGSVKIRRAGNAWEMRIAPGAMRKLGESGFRAAVKTAVTAMRRDYASEIAQLKLSVYGPGEVRP